ncbi:MAG: CoA transferase [Deltaproteobacteria bacterium]|nr:CoA transferase [Deltaproteobacteria bacterium]
MDIRFDEPASGPLRGIRVIDLSAVVSGPLCGQILGDLGADVIKIESRTGDLSRRLGPPFRDGLTPLFAHCNRNKRGIAVDLKNERGLEIVRKLARTSDVVLENYRPGVADRLGFGYAQLRRENPSLIYVSVNGFGPDGPYRDLPAYDTVIQGLVGFMRKQGRSGPPTLVRSIVADKSAAMTASYAILAALFARERGDGTGQKIDVPMLDAFAAFMLPDILAGDTFVPKEEVPFGDLDIHRAWETSDGHVVMMILEDHQFQGICRAAGLDEMIEDPRCVNLIQRVLNAPELFEILEAACKRWTTAELVERAREFGAPLAPANDVADFLCDPQVASNRTVFETEDPGAGRMRMIRNPVRFADTPTSLRRRPPRLGEHTDEVLREIGYTAEEIGALRAEGAV